MLGKMLSDLSASMIKCKQKLMKNIDGGTGHQTVTQPDGKIVIRENNKPILDLCE